MIVTAFDVIEINMEHFFFSNEFNALLKYSEENEKIKFVDKIPGENLLQENLISKLIRVDDRIYFIPLKANSIWIYDLKYKLWKEIKLRTTLCRLKFLTAEIFGDKLFLIPFRYPQIVVLDLNNDKVDYVILESNDESGSIEWWFRKDIVRWEHYLYLAHISSNYVMRFDMAAMSYQWIKTPMDTAGFSGILWDGQDFWLSPNRTSRELYRWDGKSVYEKVFLNDGSNGKIRWITFDGKYLVVQKEENTVWVRIDEYKMSQTIKRPVLFYKVLDGTKAILDNNGVYEWSNGIRTVRVDFQIEREVLDAYFSEKIRESKKGIFGEHSLITEKETLKLGQFLHIVQLC